MSRLAYFLRQALRITRASPWLSMVSVLTIAMALALVGLFAIAFFNANQLIDDLGRSLTVSVYLQDGTTRARMSAVETQLREHPGVVSVKMLTREMDRERNRRMLDKHLLEGLDEEAIPGQPVLEVELDSALASRADIDELAAWATKFEGVESIEEVSFGAERLRLLFAFVEIVRSVGFVLSVVLLASALFFVFAIIRLSVYARRAEIEVLALVGATRAFVRTPFLLEGVLQGLVGALVAMALIGALHLELRGLIRDVYMLNVGWSLLPPGMIVWLLVGGPAVGFVASGMSVARHLRV